MLTAIHPIIPGVPTLPHSLVIRQLLLLWLVAGASLSPVRAGAGTWTWIEGSNTVNQRNVYGTPGIGAPTNTPGSRAGMARWLDPQGKTLWIFGGEFFGDRRSDLWRYEIQTGMWTFVRGFYEPDHPGIYGTRGITEPGSQPGARIAAGTWTDSSGNLWLFGGAAGTGGTLNDLWKFEISTGLWTWMHGSSEAEQPAVYGEPGVAAPDNTPGAQGHPVTWTGADDRLYLLGSTSRDSGPEIWSFNPQTSSWTFLRSYPVVAHYGTQGVADPANSPGYRFQPAFWRDSHYRLWVFGGWAPGTGNMNDLWMYDPGTGNWTWVRGSDAAGRGGHASGRELFDPSNSPAARSAGAAWSDPEGNLWLYGGDSGSRTAHGDLWKFDVQLQMWAIMEFPNYRASHGVQGVAAWSNKPGPRVHAVGWSTADGRAWLFGGSVIEDSLGWNYDFWNDLWMYDFDRINRPATGFALAQPLRIKTSDGSSGYQLLHYIYDTGAIRIGAHEFETGSWTWLLRPFQWNGIFHYNYDTGRFDSGVYWTRNGL